MVKRTQMRKLSEKLNGLGFNYLKVGTRGDSISVFSEHEGKKENRCRFTKIDSGLYILSMADHNGKWEATPFEGAIEELMDMVISDFEWVLCDYNML